MASCVGRALFSWVARNNVAPPGTLKTLRVLTSVIPDTQDTMSESQQSRPQPSEVDGELLSLAEEVTPSVLRPILMLGVIATALWIVSDWREEVEFFFSPSEPIALGEVTEFASREASDPNWRPEIPHNRYVSLGGIPTQRSQAARYTYSRLVGGWVFVEERRQGADGSITAEMNDSPEGDIDRTIFQGVGRAIAFKQMPQRYNGLRDYYRTRYGLEFCETLRPEDIREMERRRRDVLISQWKVEFEAASPAERLEKQLSPMPTDGQIKEILDNNPACVDAYLVQVGVKPSDMIWYLVATAMFGGFMLFNLYGLFRWIRQFMR